METTVAPPKVESQTLPVTGLQMASRGWRLLAAIVDMAAVVVLYMFPLVFNESTVFFVGLCVLAVVQFWLLSTRGQTIGKMVMNVRVVKYDSEKNGGFVPNVLLRVIINSILAFVPFYALVDVLFIFRQDRRCIHDLIAGTKVVQA